MAVPPHKSHTHGQFVKRSWNLCLERLTIYIKKCKEKQGKQYKNE